MAGDLPHRPRAVRLSRAAAPTGARDPFFSPEAIFVLAGLSQNVGSILAKSLFDDVRPVAVAWFRVTFAAAVLLAWTWRQWWPGHRAHRPWTRADVLATAVFGVATALMNTFFYLGIDRLQFGKGLAIEFTGPVAVAALRHRSRRNITAVAFVALGVAVLGGLELGDNALGVAFILGASAMWATYIVVGSRVANQDRGLAGLGVGLFLGAVVVTPVGAPSSGAIFRSGHLFLLCCLVGLLGSVIAYSLDQHVMRRIPPHRFALLLALIPVAGAVFAFIALDERLSVLDVFGIVLVIAGVAYQQRDAADVEAVTPVEAP